MQKAAVITTCHIGRQILTEQRITSTWTVRPELF
jgi:hypothetical protein